MRVLFDFFINIARWACNIHENRSFLIEISKMEQTQASCPTNSTVTVKMKPSRIAIFLCVTSSLLMSTACAPVLIGSAAVTGVSVAADRRSAGAVANDGVIEAKSAMHLSQTNFASSHITTTSYEGNVLLSGEIDSEASKQKATEIVKSINEVNKVYNELAVQPNSSLTTRMNDSITASKVRAALLDNKQVTLTSIKVVVDRGICYLLGTVTQTEAEIISKIASRVPGVVQVVRLFTIITPEELEKRKLIDSKLQQNEAAEVTDGATEENGKLTSDDANTEEVSVSPVKL